MNPRARLLDMTDAIMLTIITSCHREESYQIHSIILTLVVIQLRERFGIQMAGTEVAALLHLKAGLEDLPEQVTIYVDSLTFCGSAEVHAME